MTKLLTKSRVREISTKAVEVLNSAFEAEGLKVQLKSGRFSDTVATLKLDFGVVGATGTVETSERAEWKEHCWKIGLTPEDLDRVFVFLGKSYTIHGFRPRAWKTPVIGKCVKTGKLYRFSAAAVRGSLATAVLRGGLTNPT